MKEFKKLPKYIKENLMQQSKLINKMGELQNEIEEYLSNYIKNTDYLRGEKGVPIQIFRQYESGYTNQKPSTEFLTYVDLDGLPLSLGDDSFKDLEEVIRWHNKHDLKQDKQ